MGEFQLNEKLSNKTDGTQTISKAIAVLKCFSIPFPALSQAEIARKLNLPVPTTSRILKVLLEEGLLFREDETKRYRLGHLISSLGAIAHETAPLRQVSSPIMERIREHFNETVILMIRDGNYRICYETLESHLPLKITVKKGTKTIIWAGASSKIFLAYMEEKERDRILEEVKPLTPHTITDREQMLREIEKVKQWGCALSQSERKEGFYSVATPVFNAYGQLAASLTLVAPSIRVTDDLLDEMIMEIKRGAAEISERLGYKNYRI